MNFTLKEQDATSARLVVSVQEADYTTLVEKTLKNIRQKANIPGFRPGMVPMGLIKKQYGTAVKAEEINKLLQTKIFEYICALDRARQTRGWGKGLSLVFCACLIATLGMTDYGWKGVLTVVVFYLFRGFCGAGLCRLAAMLVLHSFLMEGQMLPVFRSGMEIPLQTLAVLALIPIQLYSGQRGRGGKAFQYAAYAFYPVHLLLLYLLATCC